MHPNRQRKELNSLREVAEPSGTPDKPSDSPEPQSSKPQRKYERYLQYQRGLMNLHRATGIPPSVKTPNSEIIIAHDPPIAGGTHGDRRKEKWSEKQKVLYFHELYELGLILQLGSFETTSQHTPLAPGSAKGA